MTRLNVATRKGLFRFRREGTTWTAGSPDFLGEPVSAVLEDPRDGTIYAALRLGHFGPKLHRLDKGATAWTEIAVPSLPAAAPPSDKPETTPGDAAKTPALDMIWTLAAGGPDEPGVLWAGGLPAGLFRSTDRGASWTLIESLWERPERAKWFGGGYDDAGIHSILVDPRNSRRLIIGISCGGVWKSDDAGATWR